MPPKNGTSTPNEPPDSPIWTLYEGEEMHRDIDDLQKKIVTKDELQEMEAKLEAINTNMDGLNDPGGYQWPPTFSNWIKTVFW